MARMHPHYETKHFEGFKNFKLNYNHTFKENGQVLSPQFCLIWLFRRSDVYQIYLTVLRLAGLSIGWFRLGKIFPNGTQKLESNQIQILLFFRVSVPLFRVVWATWNPVLAHIFMVNPTQPNKQCGRGGFIQKFTCGAHECLFSPL